MQAECRERSAENREYGTECRVQRAESRECSAENREYGTECRVQRAESRECSAESRVQRGFIFIAATSCYFCQVLC